MIRPDRPSDARAIWTVHEAAFGRPDEARLGARLVQVAAPLVSLVAEQQARPAGTSERGASAQRAAGERRSSWRVVGHVLFSPVTLEDRMELPLGALGPVGVLPDAQGEGAGSALIRAGIEACRAHDWRVLFVLGAPAYYARFGFELAAPRGLHYESHAFDSAFQVRELVPGALAGLAGWVRYHAAFTAPS